MAKHIKASQIKKNLSYSILEAAEDLGVTTSTIRNWGKQGLPIQTDQRPYLIFGSDLRDFLAERNKARKFTLQDGELNCFTCKAARRAVNNAVIYTRQAAKTGRLSGVCGTCGGKCSRIISNAEIRQLSQIFQIQFNEGDAP